MALLIFPRKNLRDRATVECQSGGGEPVSRFRGSNHIDTINQPRPEERAPKSGLPDFGNRQCRNRQQPISMRASRRTATSDMVPASILRDAVLRTAPQDQVRGLKFQLVRSNLLHGIDLLEIAGHRRQPTPRQICRRSQLLASVALSGCTSGVAAGPAARIAARLTTRLHTA